MWLLKALNLLLRFWSATFKFPTAFAPATKHSQRTPACLASNELPSIPQLSGFYSFSPASRRAPASFPDLRSQIPHRRRLLGCWKGRTEARSSPNTSLYVGFSNVSISFLSVTAPEPFSFHYPNKSRNRRASSRRGDGAGGGRGVRRADRAHFVVESCGPDGLVLLVAWVG